MSDLSASNFRGERKNLRLENLISDPRLQGRAEPELVKKYASEVAEAVKAGKDIEPILVIRIVTDDVDENGKKVAAGDYVGDGMRRRLGYEMAARASIPAILRIGTWKDAVDVASSANINNVSLTRTPEDKRRQVEMSLRNHPDRSMRWHSQHCEVGNDLPQRIWDTVVKKSLPKEVVERIEKEGRVDRTGKKQSASNKNKGKAKKKAASAGSQKVADWKGYQDAYNFISRFVDHVTEISGTKPDKKIRAAHEQFGHWMMEWKDEIQKRADELAAKAKAAEEKAKEAAKATSAKAGGSPTREDEDGKGKG